MSKSGQRQHNFKELRAEFSERLRSNGDYVGFAQPQIFDSLRSQYLNIDARIAILKSQPSITSVERREMEDHIRARGDWAKQIREAAQLAFEHAFIVVAKARLPKEHFIVIADEARQMWREEGYANGLPIDHAKERKAQRRFKERNGHRFSVAQ